MKTYVTSCALFVLALLVGQVAAQPVVTLLPEGNDVSAKDQPKQKEKDKDKKPPEKKLTEPPQIDIFEPITSAVGNFPTFFNPAMMGDKQLIFAKQSLGILGTQATNVASTGAVTTTTIAPIVQGRNVIVPVPNRGAFNIAENESPIPRDRVFTFMSSFSNLGFPQTGPNAPITTITTTTRTTTAPPIGNRNFGKTTTTTVITQIPGASPLNLNREVFGFEKTFLDGRASIELRAPYLQQGGGNGDYGVNGVGDLTIIGKYALILDPNTGNVFSTGLAITAPTSRSIPTTDGNFNDTLFQPFVGYLWNFNRFYIQGFSSVVVPTDARDVTLAFNDIGFNYWLYRGGPDRFLSFVVPTIEAHVTTPLNHRDQTGPIIVPDAVVLTTGVHLGLGRNTTLTFGAATPVTGQRPFSVEGMVLLNIRY
jgi:hypothetical protein